MQTFILLVSEAARARFGMPELATPTTTPPTVAPPAFVDAVRGAPLKCKVNQAMDHIVDAEGVSHSPDELIEPRRRCIVAERDI